MNQTIRINYVVNQQTMLKNTRHFRFVGICIAAALILLSVPQATAKTFTQFLSAFKEGALLSEGAETDISADDVRIFLLEPAGNLEPSRPGLRALQKWSESISNALHQTPTSPENTHGFSCRLGARSRAKIGEYLVLAVSISAWEVDVDWGVGYDQTMLFSITSSGRLIDGLPLFKTPVPYGVQTTVDTLLPADLVSHQGHFRGMSAFADPPGRIVVIETYGLVDTATEVSIRDVGLSHDGTFKPLSAERRYLLSRIYTGSESSERLLFFEKANNPEPGGPIFLRYQHSKDGVPLEVEATGMKSNGSITARTYSGSHFAAQISTNGNATVADTNKAAHTLKIGYGPGQNGEKTTLTELERLGDMYVPFYRWITYLFAPTRLPVTEKIPAAEMDDSTENQSYRRGKETRVFDTRSFTIGITQQGWEQTEEDSISAGTLAEETEWPMDVSSITVSPRSSVNFEDMSIIGTLAKNLVLDYGAGKIKIAAGSRLSYNPKASEQWAIPADDTVVSLRNLTLPVPAGSTIGFYGYLESVVFAKPVQVRIDAKVLSISTALFNYPPDDGSRYLSEAGIVAPVSVSVSGKPAIFFHSLGFDAQGRVISGRLQTDTPIAVGGTTIRFRGGYDNLKPEAGILHIYPNGFVQSGVLAAAVDVRIGKSKVHLDAGGSVSFYDNGKVQKCYPTGTTMITVGGRSVGFWTEIELYPDGNIAFGELAQDSVFSAGGMTLTFPGGTYISFYPDGTVKRGMVKPTVLNVDGVEKKIEGHVEFPESPR